MAFKGGIILEGIFYLDKSNKQKKRYKCDEKIILSVGELNPGLPRDRRGYLPLY